MIRTPAQRLAQIADIEARKARDEAVLARKHAKFLADAGKQHNSPELIAASLLAFKRAENLEKQGKTP